MPQIESPLAPGAPAPPFRLPDSAGQMHDLGAQITAGQKILLFFFRGTW